MPQTRPAVPPSSPETESAATHAIAASIPQAARTNACRACGSRALAPVLSLGDMPLANALVALDRVGQQERRFPLELVFCRSCALAQLTLSVPPAELFEDYPYLSSYADAVVANARDNVERAIQRWHLGPDSLAVEIASNDGYLLQHYVRAGIRVLGIDPARNVAPLAEARGVETLCEFFSRELAARLRANGYRAHVLHANNVLAHVPDITGLVSGIATILDEDGVAIIETPYLRDLVDHLEFDTIYHEHVFYYSLTALERLFRAHGLTVIDVERIPIHGGSLRVFASRREGTPTDAVSALLDEERAIGLGDYAYYANFGERVRNLCAELRQFLRELRRGGHRIAAYGAAAKGAVLLNAIGVGHDTIEFVVDRNPRKQGLAMPGVGIPVAPAERLLQDMPDYVLLLAWNFADEILKQQAEYRARGGRFICPVPEPRVI